LQYFFSFVLGDVFQVESIWDLTDFETLHPDLLFVVTYRIRRATTIYTNAFWFFRIENNFWISSYADYISLINLQRRWKNLKHRIFFYSIYLIFIIYIYDRMLQILNIKVIKCWI